ncbi:MAG: M23 family peptidase, partial [Bacteroidetes bacterium]|nr:M23 family peptidase [Bacteroidota bacterium]
MLRVKYKYNPKSLSYEKARITPSGIILRLFGYLLAGCFFSFLIIILSYNFFESPKERAQRREIEQFKLQYQLLDDRLDQVSTVLGDMQDRDDNIYRVIFESEPIPSSTRKAGYGGVNRYAKLDGYRNSDIIIETTKKLDMIMSRVYVQSKSFD